MASIIQRTTGDWRARIARAGHASTSKVFENKKDAEDWVRRMETKQDTGTSFTTKELKSMRVRELFLRYQKEVSINRHRSDRNTVGRLMECDFANRRLDQIKQEDINDWKRTRLTQIKEESVAREMGVLSAVFKYAKTEWSMPFLHNPVMDCSRPSKEGKFRAQRWSDEHIDLYLKAVNFDDTVKPITAFEHTPWAFLIAIETAMRMGELAKLKVADFYPKDRYVTLFNTKNGDDRKVPLTTKAVKYLTFITEGKKPTDRIFNMVSETIGSYHREIRVLAGLTKDKGFDLRFHDTRHEGTSRLAKKLSGVLELGSVTGHRSFRCLQRYYNPNATETAFKLG
jgi:integrase